MASVKCFAIVAIQLWFPSGDHLPPHFHAKRRGDWELRVKFLENSGSSMFEVKWMNKYLSKQDRKVLEENVIEHRAELLYEWEQCHPNK